MAPHAISMHSRSTGSCDIPDEVINKQAENLRPDKLNRSIINNGMNAIKIATVILSARQ
jgi:hypothetical protein